MSASASTLSPVPTAVSSSDMSSEQSFLSQENDSSETPEPTKLLIGKPGETSPASICGQRKMSAAVVSSPDTQHEYVEGRPKIVLPDAPRSANKPPSKSLKKATLARTSTTPIDQRYATFTLAPPPLRLNAWSEPPATKYKIRSRGYMRDNKKILSEPAVFKLLTVDLVKSQQPIFSGLCAHPNERIQTALRHEAKTGVKELPEFIFAVNLCVPGPGTGKTHYYLHKVTYFGCDDVELLKSKDTPLGRLAEPFFFGGSDQYRDETFKMIPHIVEGNFVVKKAVGSKPAVLGNKLKQYYVRRDRFFELIVDISSNSVANRITKLSLGYAKTLTVDMMFVLEGKGESTLPERILGGVRMKNIDFKKKDGQRMCLAP